MVTQIRLKELLEYSPETGYFTWIARQGRSAAGTQAGTDRHGYTVITLDSKKYYAHRLAWLYQFGNIPPVLDHINGGASDNRICNLRPATVSQNGANRTKQQNNKSGFKGVSKTKYGWAASIRVLRKTIYLGHFNTPQRAAAAYMRAANEYFTAFAHS